MTANGTEDIDRACSSSSDIVPIKRYPNRRFYDRKSSKYVTLQEIEELVRGGQTIEVRDSKSHEDLTRVVLGQILLERQPERMEMFPIPLLHIILRANDLSLEFLRVFLRLSLATLESLQGTRTMAPFLSPFDWMRIFFPGFGPPQGLRKPDEPAKAALQSPEATVESPEDTVEQLSQLSRRVAELESKIRQLESESAVILEPPVPPGLYQRQIRGLDNRPPSK
jgi:polyhydroxyalkanoate synthesis repressor PhaR